METGTTLRLLYEEEKMTDLQIGERLGMSEHKIGRLRRRYGIRTIKRVDRNIICPVATQMQVLVGCLLGDGSISKTTKSCKQRGPVECESVFECSHGQKQHGYLWWKYRLFQSWCRREPTPIENNKLRMRSVSSQYFSELRREWYPQGVKIVPDSVRRHLTPMALAVWYMDDGHFSKTGAVRFCTCAFTQSDCEMLARWLASDFDVVANVRTYGGYNYLYIPAASQISFFKIIKPFVLPLFNYKVKHG